MINITPLEAWIREKASIGPDRTDGSYTEALQAYQLMMLNETIRYARLNTSFYRRSLSGLPDKPLSSLSDIAAIPFTDPSDIAKDPFGFLAVRQDDVAHIVTLKTSGSTGDPKRIFFTKADLELTMDFFHHGMSTIVRPGQRVAILLPAASPDSVGDLLARGLKRMDVDSLAYGPVVDPSHAAEAIASFKAHCLVGIPTQVLGVACSQAGKAIGKGLIENVLLSTDHVPRAIADTLERVWGCRVFNHYGMTETGLGGGVECEALEGYHLREADLYFEIVDHATGEPCPAGVTGEVVFTTLTREAMPLVRYRTGDIARIITEPCPCNSVLRRMGCVRGRWEGIVRFGPESLLTLPDLDEALFRLPGLLDYRAGVSKDRGGIYTLTLDVHRQEEGRPTEPEVLNALNNIDAIKKAVKGGILGLPVVRFSKQGPRTTPGTSKRKILVDIDPF